MTTPATPATPPASEQSGTPQVFTDNQRVIDMLRFCRSELHQAGLITDQEYADIVMIGSESARRLESYDVLRAELSSVRAELERVKAERDELRKAMSGGDWIDLVKLIDERNAFCVRAAQLEADLANTKAELERTARERDDATAIVANAKQSWLDSADPDKGPYVPWNDHEKDLATLRASRDELATALRHIRDNSGDTMARIVAAKALGKP